jgi:hypothetical protein
MGYQGDMNNFNTFLQQNPEANQRMDYFVPMLHVEWLRVVILRASNGVDTTGAVATCVMLSDRWGS